jgi:hypothetical protein
MGEMFWAAASPAGWPPPQHGAVARLRRAAATQNTTDSHLETLCLKLVLFLGLIATHLSDS